MRTLEDIEAKVKPLRLKMGVVKLHEADLTREEQLVCEEYRRVFGGYDANRDATPETLIREHLPLVRAMFKLTFMRYFDMFATAWVPTWLASIGDVEAEWEFLFWLRFPIFLDEVEIQVKESMEEERHTKLLFGDHWLDDDQPDIPDDDPRWQIHHDHMTTFNDAARAAFEKEWGMSVARRHYAKVNGE